MRNAIICVDDDEMMLIALKQELIEHFKGKYRYEVALNAPEALEIIDELVSDGVNVILAISDWLMPGMNGDEFLEKIDEKYPEIRTIIVTGYADMLSVSKSRHKINLKSLITKPWNTEDLIKAVESCLETEDEGLINKE